MSSRSAVWQPCELLYTCNLLTYLVQRSPKLEGTRRTCRGCTYVKSATMSGLTEDVEDDGLPLRLSSDRGRARVAARVISHDLRNVQLLRRPAFYFHISPAQHNSPCQLLKNPHRNKYVGPPYSRTRIYAACMSRSSSSRYCSISPARARPQQQIRRQSLLLSIDGTDRQTDGRTLSRFMTLTLYYADSVIRQSYTSE